MNGRIGVWYKDKVENQWILLFEKLKEFWSLLFLSWLFLLLLPFDDWIEVLLELSVELFAIFGCLAIKRSFLLLWHALPIIWKNLHELSWAYFRVLDLKLILFFSQVNEESCVLRWIPFWVFLSRITLFLHMLANIPQCCDPLLIWKKLFWGLFYRYLWKLL